MLNYETSNIINPLLIKRFTQVTHENIYLVIIKLSVHVIHPCQLTSPDSSLQSRALTTKLFGADSSHQATSSVKNTLLNFNYNQQLPFSKHLLELWFTYSISITKFHIVIKRATFTIKMNLAYSYFCCDMNFKNIYKKISTWLDTRLYTFLRHIKIIVK